MNIKRFNELKRVGYAVGPSSLIVGMGLALHAQPYGDGVGMLLACAAAGSGYVAFHKSITVAWGIAAGLAYAAAVTWLGVSWETLLAWGAASSSALGLRLWFEHSVKGHDLDKRIKMQKLETGTIRQEAALLRLQQQMLTVAVEPSLTGHTPEETALRTAVWQLFKQELLGCFVEPTGRGWRAVVSLPPALDREKFRREWGKVAGALAGTGKYALDNGSADNQIMVKYSTNSTFPDRIAYVPDEYGDLSDPVYLGPDEDDLATLLQLLDRHTLLLGTSGNGKSNIANLLILAAVRRGMAVIGIDMKKGVELAPVSPLLVTVAKDGEMAREVFDWLDQETDRRSDIMIREGIRNWSEEFGPYILLVVDEMAELTDKRWKVDGLPTLPELNAAASRLYRAFGIYLLEATQAPSAAAFGGSTDSRTNYKNRISTRLEEATHAQYAFGQDWKAKGWDPNTLLGGKGEYMLRNEEYRKPLVRKAPYLSNEDLANEVVRLADYKVGLDGSPWGEGGVPITVDTRVLNLLRHRHEVIRTEIETGLGLDRKQVLNAIDRLRRRKGVEIEYDTALQVYRMATDGPRGLAELE